jgi:hypothetical protein
MYARLITRYGFTSQELNPTTRLGMSAAVRLEQSPVHCRSVIIIYIRVYPWPMFFWSRHYPRQTTSVAAARLNMFFDSVIRGLAPQGYDPARLTRRNMIRPTYARQ